jgi:hypothetical protein
MMTQRTPLVSGISYVGTDGASKVTVAGEKITVASDDLAHFDWVHDDTPEARHAAVMKKAEAGEKAAAKPAAAPKAAEKS